MSINLPNRLVEHIRSLISKKLFSSKEIIPNHEKISWDNKPVFYVKGVAQYENIKVAVQKVHLEPLAPELIYLFGKIFLKVIINRSIDFRDISGVTAFSKKSFEDHMDCVDLEHFIQIECRDYLHKNSEKDFEARYEVFSHYIKSIFEKNEGPHFKIWGWNTRLFYNCGDGTHRSCHAVAYAKQTSLVRNVDVNIEVVYIDPSYLKIFDAKYQSYIVPKDETSFIDRYIKKYRMQSIALSYDLYFPEDCYIYFIHKAGLPSDFVDTQTNIDQLELKYTNFNKVLAEKLIVQVQNLIFIKYGPEYPPPKKDLK